MDSPGSVRNVPLTRFTQQVLASPCGSNRSCLHTRSSWRHRTLGASPSGAHRFRSPPPTPRLRSTQHSRATACGTELHPLCVVTGQYHIGSNGANLTDYYTLRNSVILAAIFPSLKGLCTWQTYGTARLLSDRTFKELLQTIKLIPNLIALPLLPPESTPNNSPQPQKIQVRDFFPKDTHLPPSQPRPSPWAIADNIRTAIEHAQLMALQC